MASPPNLDSAREGLAAANPPQPPMIVIRRTGFDLIRPLLIWPLAGRRQARAGQTISRMRLLLRLGGPARPLVSEPRGLCTKEAKVSMQALITSFEAKHAAWSSRARRFHIRNSWQAELSRPPDGESQRVEPTAHRVLA